MAALKLKGYNKATTNFLKESYQQEPFMRVGSGAVSSSLVKHAGLKLVRPAVIRPSG